MKPAPLLILAGVVGIVCGLVPLPLVLFPACLSLGILSAFALINLPSGERMAWGAGLCGIASLTATSFSRSFFLVIVFWFPWFMLFVLPLIGIIGSKLTWIKRTGLALVFPAFLYLGSALILFHFWGGQPAPDTETRDSKQREPAVGPAVSLLTYSICPPQGPCCVLSCDYDGSEWVWKVYKPLVDRWFAAPGCRYYDPEKPSREP